MRQRQVRAVFSRRQAMVEPVFSHLRGQQNLNRFRRSGLQAVKREFALHVMAYNLSRAVALLRALFLAFYAGLSRLSKVLHTFLMRIAQFDLMIFAIRRYGHLKVAGL
mgnify:CR=1 FL=1